MSMGTKKEPPLNGRLVREKTELLLQAAAGQEGAGPHHAKSNRAGFRNVVRNQAEALHSIKLWGSGRRRSDGFAKLTYIDWK